MESLRFWGGSHHTEMMDLQEGETDAEMTDVRQTSLQWSNFQRQLADNQGFGQSKPVSKQLIHTTRAVDMEVDTVAQRQLAGGRSSDMDVDEGATSAQLLVPISGRSRSAGLSTPMRTPSPWEVNFNPKERTFDPFVRGVNDDQDGEGEMLTPSDFLDKMLKQWEDIRSEVGNDGDSDEVQTTVSAVPEINPEFAKLVENGYQRVAEFLSNNSGEPWDSLVALNSPVLIEQLIDIYRLAIHKNGGEDSEQVQQIVRIGIEIAASAGRRPTTRSGKRFAFRFGDNREVNMARESLGKLMFMLNENPEKALQLVSGKSTHEAIHALNEAFGSPNRVIQGIRDRLQEVEKAHNKTGLQRADRASSTQLPIELANILVMDDGSINIGFIDTLMKEFVKGRNTKRNYQVNLLYGLRFLARSPHLRAKFENVRLSENPYAPGTKVVRDILGIAAGNPVSDIQAKKAALSAILSHPRQGPVGSCFATYLTIEMMCSFLDRCLDDFSSLISEGKLSRMVDGNREEFPFLTKMSHEDIKTEISFNKKGKISGKGKGFLWESPGLLAALNSVGIPETMREGLLKATAGHFIHHSDRKTAKTTVGEFLEQLSVQIESRLGAGRVDRGQLAADMRFAFGAQTNHALLRVWENSIAGMSEIRADGIMKGRIVGSTLWALNYRLQEIGFEDENLRQLMLFSIANVLMARVSLQYDPDFEYDKVANDGHSTAGAFVLYDKSGGPELADWIRIDNPQEFERFTQSVIMNAMMGLYQQMGPSEDFLKLRNAMEQLSAFTRLDEYAYIMLHVFSFKPLKIEDPLRHYEQLKYTPWVCKIGNHAHEVLRVYHEMEELPETYVFQPYSAEHLLTKIIELGRENPSEVQKMFHSNPYRLVPVVTPGCHAFSLTIGEKSLRAAWSNEDYPPEWIHNNLVVPGREVAQSKVPKHIHRKMLDYCKQSIISEEKFEEFEKKFRRIPHNLWYSDFRNRILTLVHEVEGYDLKNADRLPTRIDSKLFESLAGQVRSKLTKTMVRFADTNWNDDSTKDMWFAFMYNPFSDRLEVVLVTDDDNEIRAINQKDWLTEQEWEFFTEPPVPVQHNSGVQAAPGLMQRAGEKLPGFIPDAAESIPPLWSMFPQKA